MRSDLAVRSPVGVGLSCQGWSQEALMRLAMNGLDPALSFGGTHPVARNWPCFEKIIETLRRLGEGETLLIQSGKPVGVFATHSQAPRILMAQSNLVGKWANGDEQRRLEELDLMVYSQLGGGSWMRVGTQAFLQSAYELLVACARREFGGELSGRLLLSGGLGSAGAALPLAAKLLGALFLVVDVDRRQVERALELGRIDQLSDSLTEAIDLLLEARRAGRSLSVGLVGNISQIVPQLCEGGILPDLVTDQTAAHDLRNGYIPAGLSLSAAEELRMSDPSGYEERVLDSMEAHVAALLEMQKAGACVFEMGNNLRAQVADHRHMSQAFEIPGFVSRYLRPLFARGITPVTWVALSGDPADIAATDQAVLSDFSYNERLTGWIHHVRDHFPFEGLPARVCWLDPSEKRQLAERLNWLVGEGLVAAPLAVGRDQFDGASPHFETEELRDGTDAVSDWPMLTALLNGACGADLVSVVQGGQVGVGYSQQSSFVCIAKGTKECGERLAQVMECDASSTVMRHADAGYPASIELALRSGLDLPTITGPKDPP